MLSMLKLFADTEFGTHCARKQVSGEFYELQKKLSDMCLFVDKEMYSEAN